MLFRFEAQISRRTGSPMARAYHPARILPKFPVGTQRSTSSPGRIFAAGDEEGVSPDVINDLRGEAAPVDGIARRKLDRLSGQIVAQNGVEKQGFDSGLAVVEVAADGEHFGVRPVGRGHLEALDFADAAVRVEHDDGNAVDVLISLRGRPSPCRRTLPPR